LWDQAKAKVKAAKDSTVGAIKKNIDLVSTDRKSKMQATTEPVFLLLKDKEGEKATHLLGLSIPRQIHTSSCKVLQGELVTPIPHSERVPRSDGQNTHNFRTVSRDSPATFYEADDGTDLAPLSANEYGVLVGVKSLWARYQIFLKSGKLDWGAKLKIGDQVSVELPRLSTPDRASAVVRYVGEVKTLPGITFGVEITDKNYLGWGTSDGLFQEHQYFRCRADCAMFVSLEKLSRHPPVDSLTQPPPSGQHYTPQPKDRRTSSSTETSADPPNFIYKIGDRVVVFTKKEVPVHGVVKWVGMHSFMVEKKQKSFKCVGIETDVKVKSNEIESLPSKSHLFTVTKGKSAVFLLEDQVLLEAIFAEEPPEKPPVPDRPISTETRKMLHDALHEHGSPQQPAVDEEGGSEGESADLARAMGVQHSVFLQQQREVLQEIKQKRRQQELEEIKQAMPDQSLNVSGQERMLRQISEERNREAERGRRQGRGGSDQHHEQKENVYETVGPGEFHQGIWKPDHHQVHQQGQPSPDQHVIGHQQQNGPQQNGQHPTQPGWQAPDHPLQPDTEQQQPGHCQYDHHTSQNVPHTRAPHGPPSAGPHGPPSAVSTHHGSSTVPPYLQPGHQHMAYDGQQRSSHPAGLEVGSAVQIANNDSRTGVVRWIGPLPGVQGEVAGVELDEPMGGCGDGEWNGHRYFTCPYGRGLFCPLVNLRPDTRIMSQYAGGHGAAAAGHGNPLQVSDWEPQDQTVPGDQFHKYIGDQRGIQGHQNSCYLDATIFGLFALSDVFDSLFLNSEVLKGIMQGGSGTPAQQVQRDIGEKLWKGIVNPLRRNGAVRFESVMRLRNKLDELGKMEGVSTAEKDPEEFLNMLFKHTLHVEPFIQIKRPFGTEPEFFVQLFVEFDESLKIPTIDTLLQRMFKEQQISFAEVPSKLLIQVPRYGKQFQTYKRIIPRIKLDATPLLDCPYSCFICGEPAWNTCCDCKKDFNDTGDKVSLCDTCDGMVHKHKSRSSHKREQYKMIADAGELELLSVLCIETSHYVCFTRDVEGRWLFFDSMANRVYDQYNIPRGVDCTAELTEWVYEGSPERLMAAGPRDLPELVRRFTQDVYMCVYIQPDYGMYG
jgi:ubiquitin thioesterase CYLD